MTIFHIFISFSRNSIPITESYTLKIMHIISKTIFCQHDRVSTTAQQISRLSWKMILDSNGKHHSWRYKDEDSGKPSMRSSFQVRQR